MQDVSGSPFPTWDFVNDIQFLSTAVIGGLGKNNEITYLFGRGWISLLQKKFSFRFFFIIYSRINGPVVFL